MTVEFVRINKYQYQEKKFIIFYFPIMSIMLSFVEFILTLVFPLLRFPYKILLITGLEI